MSVTADAAIVPEPYGPPDIINTVTCGTTTLVIHTKGSCIGSRYHDQRRRDFGCFDTDAEGGPVDAFRKMVKVLDALEKMEMTYEPWAKMSEAPGMIVGTVKAGRGDKSHCCFSSRFLQQLSVCDRCVFGNRSSDSLLFASEGASVVVADVDETGGHETVRLIEEKSGRSTFIKTDVTDSSQVNDMVLAAVETYGGLDILFANAGVDTPLKLVTDTTDEEWERVIDVNLTGVFRSCRAAIPEIAKRGGGAIVATASDVGLKPHQQFSPYCASKAGVISLAKTLAIECAPLRIRVNAVAPGETNTAMGIKALVGECYTMPLTRFSKKMEDKGEFLLSSD